MCAGCEVARHRKLNHSANDVNRELGTATRCISPTAAAVRRSSGWPVGAARATTSFRGAARPARGCPSPTRFNMAGLILCSCRPLANLPAIRILAATTATFRGARAPRASLSAPSRTTSGAGNSDDGGVLGCSRGGCAPHLTSLEPPHVNGYDARQFCRARALHRGRQRRRRHQPERSHPDLFADRCWLIFQEDCERFCFAMG